MNNSDTIRDFLECMKSLNKAVVDAGGSKLDLEDLERMTALELISLICTNGIRFHYEKTVVVAGPFDVQPRFPI
jgi:hypothetical protein